MAMQCNTLKVRGEPGSRFDPSRLVVAWDVIRETVYGDQLPSWVTDDEEPLLHERNAWDEMIAAL